MDVLYVFVDTNLRILCLISRLMNNGLRNRTNNAALSLGRFQMTCCVLGISGIAHQTALDVRRTSDLSRRGLLRLNSRA